MLYRITITALVVWITLADIVMIILNLLHSGEIYPDIFVRSSRFVLLAMSTTLWAVSFWGMIARSRWGRSHLRLNEYTGYLIAFVGSIQFTIITNGFDWSHGKHGWMTYVMTASTLGLLCLSKVIIWRFWWILANADEVWPWMSRSNPE